MNRGLLIQIRKEFRALLPWWAGIVAVMAICLGLELAYLKHSPSQMGLLVVSLCTYALGAICLGALSFGHEYGHRTLPCLLAQPIARKQVLIVKGVALSVLLGLLALVGRATLEIPLSWPTSPRTAIIFWLPLLCAVCLAPWLTLVSRGTLPGVVFTVALAVVLFITGGWLGVPYVAIWPIVGVLAVVAAMLTWRTFVRLEVAGDRSSEFDLVPWSIARPTSTRTTVVGHPAFVLVRKELRLQQVTFGLGAFITTLWIAVSLTESLAPDRLPAGIRYVAAFVIGGLVSVLCGALASAEERQLGTADWQRLLPVTHRAQWAIKAGTALAVALLLAAALPAVLHAIAPEPLMNEGFHPMAVVLLCVSALYVSSLSDSGIQATLATVPVMAAATGIAAVLFWPITAVAAPAVQALAEWVTPLLDITQPAWRWRYYPLNAGWVAGVGMVLVFAGANHRTADRSRSRVLRQCAWLVALAVTTVLLWMLTELVLLEWRRLALLNS